MYKLLLCCRYLRTRFLAFVCIVSVMLGVATLVVVNSVMSGFSTKLKERLHGHMSDVIIETPNYNGFHLNDAEMLKRINDSAAGPLIEAMAPSIEVVAMLNYEFTAKNEFDRGLNISGERQKVTRPVRLFGIDAKTRSSLGGFSENLVDPIRRANPSFEMNDNSRAWFRRIYPLEDSFDLLPQDWPVGVPVPDAPPHEISEPKGIIVGYALASYRDHNVLTGALEDVFVIQPGDVVNVLTVGAGKQDIQPVYSPFVVVDYVRTEMAEYDSNFVFVPLDYLQKLRGTPDHSTHIQIKLKDYKDAAFVTEELRHIFPDRYSIQISTWEQKQGALLAAIDIERGILNLLLFLIIGVAGFNILAIFSMIVVE